MHLLSFYHKIIKAAFLTGCFFIAACENDTRKIEEWTKNVSLKEEAYHIQSYLSQDGKMKAKLTSPLMVRENKDTQSVEFPKTLHCDFYDSTNQVETWLDAKYGIYYESLNKVYIRDSVVVITVKGDTLKSPDLWWDQNRKLFYSDKYAIYHGKGMNVTGGKGIEATQDLKRVTFSEASGNVKVSENGSVPSN
jgi:lipopolysaccharide export system protein LptC